ncbi:hypothetical protein B0H16DRAFT_1479258 [Mycena metata]|uniref:Uncharacterized protein n=1 Tax=Mycena metata TaxID=1033252 RepID=A0AAD7H572_9AGAR|nr:hypothetical protein B0H16DRAFT_1479258 [Mycena metata]
MRTNSPLRVPVSGSYMDSAKQYADTATWIESRTSGNEGNFFPRHPSLGYFAGTTSSPTWVPPVGIPFTLEPPLFSPGMPLGYPSKMTEDPNQANHQAVREVNQPSGSTAPTSLLSPDDRSDHSIREAVIREDHRQETGEFCDRGQRGQVNQTAHITGSCVQRCELPPDVYRAVHSCGHPQFPRRPTSDGSLPDYPVSLSDFDYNTVEKERRKQAANYVLTVGRVIHPIREPDSALVGPWRQIRLLTVAEAANFERWLVSGWILRTYIGDPTAWRTEGESYILQRQHYVISRLRDHDNWKRDGRSAEPVDRRLTLQLTPSDEFGAFPHSSVER